MCLSAVFASVCASARNQLHVVSLALRTAALKGSRELGTVIQSFQLVYVGKLPASLIRTGNDRLAFRFLPRDVLDEATLAGGRVTTCIVHLSYRRAVASTAEYAIAVHREFVFQISLTPSSLFIPFFYQNSICGHVLGVVLRSAKIPEYLCIFR